VLLGARLLQHGRDLLRGFLQSWRLELLRAMSAPSVSQQAARGWQDRLVSEVESARRFTRLHRELRAFGASSTVVEMAARASKDELRHAEFCRGLVLHFGGSPRAPAETTLRSVAPRELGGKDALFYEVIALCVVTETLSVALLGELVERSRDPTCEQTLRSILRDEVQHSRLGWAFLAEEHQRGLRDCVGAHLPALLDATLGKLFFTAAEKTTPPPELEGMGFLALSTRQRVVRETLQHVVFAGLEHFGVDTASGRRWLRPQPD
jgi:hypothetical protein